MTIDPVCGVEVEDEPDAPQSDYGGQTYFFCSQSCKQQFDDEPGIYAHQQAA